MQYIVKLVFPWKACVQILLLGSCFATFDNPREAYTNSIRFLSVNLIYTYAFNKLACWWHKDMCNEFNELLVAIQLVTTAQGHFMFSWFLLPIKITTLNGEIILLQSSFSFMKAADTQLRCPAFYFGFMLHNQDKCVG